MIFHYRSSSPPVNGADCSGNFPAQITDSLAQSGHRTIGRFFFGIAGNARLFDNSHFLVCAIENRPARKQLTVAFTVSLETQHLDFDVITRSVSGRPGVNNYQIRVEEQRKIFRENPRKILL